VLAATIDALNDSGQASTTDADAMRKGDQPRSIRST
jgi:hypothetical protein